jgi:molybdate transport system ATP-binding protein
MSGLDAGLKRQVIPFLLRVRDTLDVPLLLVSHELREVLQMTDRLLLLERGGCAGQGRYLDLVQQSGLVELLHASGLVNVLRIEPGGPLGRLADAAGAAAGSGAAARTAGIRPEDIALATAPVANTSIQNQVPGTVRRLVTSGGRVLVEVDVGASLLAQITPAAAAQLHIAPGRTVWCLIKTSAIEWL